jgi:NADPH-dependent 2,4-dienoyl-CoA reductase/sulfur reductase-like enzyme
MDKQGCELAEFLIKRGRKVTLIDSQSTEDGKLNLSAGLSLVDISFFTWLNEKGVSILSGIKCDEITDKGLVVVNKDGSKTMIEADTIIPLPPLQPNNQLLKRLEGKFHQVYVVGDCREPRLIADAVADGWRVARKI